MASRRSFLHLLGAGLFTPFAVRTAPRSPQRAPGDRAVRAFRAFGGALGLQLYSLRHQMEKDVPGTLALVRDWGFKEVETAGFYGGTAADVARQLKRANLKATNSQTVPMARCSIR